MKTRMLRLGTAVLIALIALAVFGTFASLAAPAEPSAAVNSSSNGSENGILARRFITPTFGVDLSSVTARPGNDGSASGILARRVISPSFGIVISSLDLVERGAQSSVAEVS